MMNTEECVVEMAPLPDGEGFVQMTSTTCEDVRKTMQLRGKMELLSDKMSAARLSQHALNPVWTLGEQANFWRVPSRQPTRYISTVVRV